MDRQPGVSVRMFTSVRDPRAPCELRAAGLLASPASAAGACGQARPATRVRARLA